MNNPLPPRKIQAGRTVYIYRRDGRHEEQEQKSLEQQRKEILDYFKKHELEALETDKTQHSVPIRLLEKIMDFVNEEKSKQISAHTKRGILLRVQRGYSSGGMPPRGYRMVREESVPDQYGKPRNMTKWEPDPKFAPLATMAFNMMAEGKGLERIMRAPCGKLYKSKSGWMTFFRNKSYLGIAKGLCKNNIRVFHEGLMV